MAKRPNIIRELASYLMENKKWWLVPMMVAVALLAALVFFSGTPVAPFIYTLF